LLLKKIFLLLSEEMSRWVEKEQNSLSEMRIRLKEKIEDSPPYPDIIGDRKLIRFLRGRNNNIDEACQQYSDFLKWRKDNNVNAIRDAILYEGIDHPYKFPMGEKIIELAPQIVIAPNAFDHIGQPITLETFGFDPNSVFEHVTIEQYLVFLIYSLEFRALILEQISEEREKQYLQENMDESSRVEGYGVVVKTCTIRDLKGERTYQFVLFLLFIPVFTLTYQCYFHLLILGVGLAHAGSKAKALIQASLDVALRKYSNLY
jgi:hypothetical protein